MSDDFYIPPMCSPDRETAINIGRNSGKMWAATNAAQQRHNDMREELASSVPVWTLASQLLVTLLRAKQESLSLAFLNEPPTSSSVEQTSHVNRIMASITNSCSVNTRIAVDGAVTIIKEKAIRSSIPTRLAFVDKLVTHMCPVCFDIRRCSKSISRQKAKSSSTSSSSIDSDDDNSEESASSDSSSESPSTGSDSYADEVRTMMKANATRCPLHQVHRIVDLNQNPAATTEAAAYLRLIRSPLSIPEGAATYLGLSHSITSEWTLVREAVGQVNAELDVSCPQLVSTLNDEPIAKLPRAEGQPLSRTRHAHSSHSQQIGAISLQGSDEPSSLRRSTIFENVTDAFGDKDELAVAMTQRMMRGCSPAEHSSLSDHLTCVEGSIARILTCDGVDVHVKSNNYIECNFGTFAENCRLLLKHSAADTTTAKCLFQPSMLVLHLARAWLNSLAMKKKEKKGEVKYTAGGRYVGSAAQSIALATWVKVREPVSHVSTSPSLEATLVSIVVSIFETFLDFASAELTNIVQTESSTEEEGAAAHSALSQTLFSQLPFLFVLPSLLEALMPPLLEPFSAANTVDSRSQIFAALDRGLASIAPTVVLTALLTFWSPSDAALSNTNGIPGASSIPPLGTLIDSFFDTLVSTTNQTINQSENDTPFASAPSSKGYQNVVSHQLLSAAYLKAVTSNFRDSGRFVRGVLEDLTATGVKLANRAEDGAVIKKVATTAAKGRGILQEHGKEGHSLDYDEKQAAFAAKSSLDCNAAARSLFLSHKAVGEARERCTATRSEIQRKLEEVQALLAELAEETSQAVAAEANLLKAVENASIVEMADRECWNRLTAMSSNQQQHAGRKLGTKAARGS